MNKFNIFVLKNVIFPEKLNQEDYEALAIYTSGFYPYFYDFSPNWQMLEQNIKKENFFEWGDMYNCNILLDPYLSYQFFTDGNENHGYFYTALINNFPSVIQQQQTFPEFINFIDHYKEVLINLSLKFKTRNPIKTFRCISIDNSINANEILNFKDRFLSTSTCFYKSFLAYGLRKFSNLCEEKDLGFIDMNYLKEETKERLSETIKECNTKIKIILYEFEINEGTSIIPVDLYSGKEQNNELLITPGKNFFAKQKYIGNVDDYLNQVKTNSCSLDYDDLIETINFVLRHINIEIYSVYVED